MTTPVIETVVASLQRRLIERKGQHPKISRESGVPMTTLKRVMRFGEKANPTTATVSKLKEWLDAADALDYFESKGQKS